MDFWIFAVTFALLVYFLNRHFFSYWSRRGFPYKEPSFLLGIIGEMVSEKKCFGEFFEKIYHKYKVHKLLGIYLSYKPVLVVNDYQLAQEVMVKSFNSFHDRGAPINEEVDPLTGHLFLITGQRWRDLRVKLSPTFTSGKLKGMYPTIHNCAQVLQEYFEKNVKNGNDIFDIRDVLARFTTNVISSVAFGIENDCINDPGNIFIKMGAKIFEPSIKRSLSGILARFVPKFCLYFGIKRIPQDVEDFFMSVVKQTIEFRDDNKDYERKDFMQLLIQLKNQGFVPADKNNENTSELDKDVKKLTVNEVAAQAFLFFIAGFETSSSTSNFCLFELAKHPEIQKKVQEEIDRAMKEANSSEITYDNLHKMKYLECCIDETLRKYPIVPILNRICSKDHTFSNSNWTVQKGTLIFIPVLGMHRDPDVFQNPLEFRPERFLDSPNGSGNFKDAVYMPFGDGPRNCIGARMGKLQTKIGLAMILSKFSFELVDEDLMDIEIEFERKQFILTPKNKILLKARVR